MNFSSKTCLTARGPSRGNPVRHLRWWIGALLFASTVINFIDRQTLSVLAPFLKREYQWSNTDFASILISFRIAYTVMQSLSGRILDRLGTRRGLAWSVCFYSIVAAMTSIARGLIGFRLFRLLLGAGEAANWPGATKAVSEWFPAKERAWAVALFDSGSAIGGAVAPLLVVFLYRTFGSWRPAFLLTGALGFLWLIAWLALYRSPENHPKLSKSELEYIRRNRSESSEEGMFLPLVGWGTLLRYRQAWGIMLGRFLLDPYWFLMSEWFALFLVSKGFTISQGILGFWAPFLAADLGNFCGGGLSSSWIATSNRTPNFRTQHASIDASRLSNQLWSAYPVVLIDHVCLRRMLDNVPFAARRCIPYPRRCHDERTERNLRGSWNTDFNLRNRSDHRPDLVPTGDHRGITCALRRHDDSSTPRKGEPHPRS